VRAFYPVSFFVAGSCDITVTILTASELGNSLRQDDLFTGSMICKIALRIKRGWRSASSVLLARV